MTLPPYEWPTRITGLLTRPIVAFVKATSSAVEFRPYCAAMHSYPSACRGTINLLKQEPSAQSPWQKTILGLVCIDFAVILVLLFSFQSFSTTSFCGPTRCRSLFLQHPFPNVRRTVKY